MLHRRQRVTRSLHAVAPPTVIYVVRGRLPKFQFGGVSPSFSIRQVRDWE